MPGLLVCWGRPLPFVFEERRVFGLGALTLELALLIVNVLLVTLPLLAGAERPPAQLTQIDFGTLVPIPMRIFDLTTDKSRAADVALLAAEGPVLQGL